MRSFQWFKQAFSKLPYVQYQHVFVMGAGVGGVYLVRVALGLIFLSPIGGFGHNLSCSLITEESEPSIHKFRKRASPLPAVLCVWGFKGAVLWATMVESRQVVFRAGVEPGNSKRKGDRPLHI